MITLLTRSAISKLIETGKLQVILKKMKNKEEKSAIEFYAQSAEQYHNLRTKKYPQGWFYNELLEMPATLELLGKVRGKRILDFGCGSGIYARLLAKRGAKIKGFDLSPDFFLC